MHIRSGATEGTLSERNKAAVFVSIVGESYIGLADKSFATTENAVPSSLLGLEKPESARIENGKEAHSMSSPCAEASRSHPLCCFRMRTLHMYLRNYARDSESCNCARLVQILVPIPARLAPSHLPRLLFHQASEIFEILPFSSSIQGASAHPSSRASDVCSQSPYSSSTDMRPKACGKRYVGIIDC